MATDFQYVETKHYHYVEFTVDNGDAEKTYNSYSDFGLYLEEPADVSAPEPNTYMVEVPGRNGNLDLTESAIGAVTYGDRTITFQFLCRKRRSEWNRVYYSFVNAVHGKACKISCSDDPTFFYEGRAVVNKLDRTGTFLRIEVIATVRPFKTKKTLTTLTSALGVSGNKNASIPGEIKKSKIQSVWTASLSEKYGVDWDNFSSITVTYTIMGGLPSLTVSDSSGNYYVETDNPVEHDIVTTITKNEIESAGVVWNEIKSITVDCFGANIKSVTGAVLSSATILAHGSVKPVIPLITVPVPIVMIVGGKSYSISTGTWSSDTVTIRGDTTFAFRAVDSQHADGTVSVTYQEEWL